MSKRKTGLTVKQLLDVAAAARKSIRAGRIKECDAVYFSLEVCKDGDESTYGNRVHGGEVVEAGINTNVDSSQYVHIQLIGEPNFKVYL